MCAIRSRRWPNKRAWEQIVDIWPILLEFGPLNDLLLFVSGHWWCRSLAKVTKRVKIERSKLFFVIPKTISVIPYPYNFSVSYPLSLELFCQLSLPCIRLARGKFELTNQDLIGGKNSNVLTSSWNQTTFVTGDGIKYPRKGFTISKTNLVGKKWKILTILCF